MPKGGARTRSGPAPDPNALRRDRKSDGEWLLLPAEGRKGDPPAWPLLPPRFTVEGEEIFDAARAERELEVWASLWSKPQGVAWERFGLVEQVAIYCRRWCEIERAEASTSRGTLVRQLADSLGLTMPGMHSLRWRIAADETATKRAERTAPVKRASSRDRLKVVTGDGA